MGGKQCFYGVFFTLKRPFQTISNLKSRTSNLKPDQHVPDSHNVADGTGKDEEMEDTVHVSSLIETVEDGSRDVAYPLSDDPDDGSRTHIVKKGFECHEHAQAHGNEADGLEVAVFLEVDKTGDGAGDGAGPDEDEESPTPEPVASQGNERDGGVGTGDVPVDGGMVPLSHALFPFACLGQGVVDGGGDVRAHHADEVEDDAGACPSVSLSGADDEEDDTYHAAEHDAGGVRPSVDMFFFPGVVNHLFLFGSQSHQVT